MALEVFAPAKPPQLNGTGVQKEERALEATFNDGAYQGAPDGLNAMVTKATLVWNAAPNAVREYCDDFYERHGKTKPFAYTLPGRSVPMKFRFVGAFEDNGVSGSLDGFRVGVEQDFGPETI